MLSFCYCNDPVVWIKMQNNNNTYYKFDNIIFFENKFMSHVVINYICNAPTIRKIIRDKN